MSWFVYRAANKKGEIEKGGLTALDESELVRTIRSRDLFPLEVREVEEGEYYRKIESFQKKKKRILLFLRRKIPLKTLVFLLRDLASMVGAGIVITRALEILRDQVHQDHVRHILRSMGEIVSQGKPFSEALAKYPDSFPPLVSEMVSVGEQSGRLEEVLERLALFYERQEEMESKFRQALVYPSVIVFVASCAVTVFLTVALPRFVELYEEVEAELPLITRLLIGLSNFLKDYGIIAILIFALLGLILKFVFRRIVAVRRYVQALFLKVPLFGPLYGRVVLSRILRAISAMYRSGIPILTIFGVIPHIVRNVIFESAVRRIESRIRRGESLPDAFIQEKIFPPVVANILHVGVEGGKLDDGLDRLASRFEAEVDRTTKALGTLLEPFFIILMGGFVLFIALALFLPMVKIVGVLSEAPG